MLATLALATVLFAPPTAAPAAPVTLERKFRKGDVLNYEVVANLQAETRELGLNTFMPHDIELRYRFSTEVLAMKADGIAEVRYRRPTFTERQGETYDEPAKTNVERVNQVLKLTVSPINEVLSVTDEAPKKPAPRRPGGLFFMNRQDSPADQLAPLIGRFLTDLYRLSAMVGSFDSGMDFMPRLPLDAVKAGDTWERTTSYQPRSLGSGGRQAVQRLDTKFTYRGLVSVNGQNVHRVDAELKLDTDLAAFVNQMLEVKPDESNLKSIPLKLTQNVRYDLDPKDLRTLRAVAETEGGFQIVVNQFPNEPVQEERVKARTVMRLLPPAK